MMNTYLITYDLGTEPWTSYEKLKLAIEKIGSARKIQRSTWILVTGLSEVDIKDTLIPYLDSNDSLFVAKFSSHSSYNIDNSNSVHLTALIAAAQMVKKAQLPR